MTRGASWAPSSRSSVGAVLLTVAMPGMRCARMRTASWKVATGMAGGYVARCLCSTATVSDHADRPPSAAVLSSYFRELMRALVIQRIATLVTIVTVVTGCDKEIGR